MKNEGELYRHFSNITLVSMPSNSYSTNNSLPFNKRHLSFALTSMFFFIRSFVHSVALPLSLSLCVCVCVDARIHFKYRILYINASSGQSIQCAIVYGCLRETRSWKNPARIKHVKLNFIYYFSLLHSFNVQKFFPFRVFSTLVTGSPLLCEASLSIHHTHTIISTIIAAAHRHSLSRRCCRHTGRALVQS